jgi:hypothetical protein
MVPPVCSTHRILNYYKLSCVVQWLDGVLLLELLDC